MTFLTVMELHVHQMSLRGVYRIDLSVETERGRETNEKIKEMIVKWSGVRIAFIAGRIKGNLPACVSVCVCVCLAKSGGIPLILIRLEGLLPSDQRLSQISRKCWEEG